MDYDTGLFIDIIESIPGVVFLRRDDLEDVHVHFYQGLKGKLVMVDTSFEEITESMGRGYLNDLGLEYLIPSLFPSPPAVPENAPALAVDEKTPPGAETI